MAELLYICHRLSVWIIFMVNSDERNRFRWHQRRANVGTLRSHCHGDTHVRAGVYHFVEPWQVACTVLCIKREAESILKCRRRFSGILLRGTAD